MRVSRRDVLQGATLGIAASAAGVLPGFAKPAVGIIGGGIGRPHAGVHAAGFLERGVPTPLAKEQW